MPEATASCACAWESGGRQGDEGYPLFQRRRIFLYLLRRSPDENPCGFASGLPGVSGKDNVHRNKRITNSRILCKKDFPPAAPQPSPPATAAAMGSGDLAVFATPAMSGVDGERHDGRCRRTSRRRDHRRLRHERVTHIVGLAEITAPCLPKSRGAS